MDTVANRANANVNSGGKVKIVPNVQHCPVANMEPVMNLQIVIVKMVGKVHFVRHLSVQMAVPMDGAKIQENVVVKQDFVAKIVANVFHIQDVNMVIV